MDNSNTKPGAIFYSSWGYDQTNITFYQVIRLIGKCSVEVSEIQAIQCEKSRTAFGGTIMPKPDCFIGDSFRKRLLDGYKEGQPLLKMSSFEHAWPWDGKPKAFTSYA